MSKAFIVSPRLNTVGPVLAACRPPQSSLLRCAGQACFLVGVYFLSSSAIVGVFRTQQFAPADAGTVASWVELCDQSFVSTAIRRRRRVRPARLSLIVSQLMKPPDPTELREFNKPRDRFFRLVIGPLDLTHAILKSHLLIEEVLTSLISEAVGDVMHIEKARLTFFQKLCLVQALHPHFSKPGIWKFIEKFNSIRNLYSHHAEPPNLESKLKDLFLLAEKIDILSNHMKDMNNTKALVTIIGVCWAYLTGYCHGGKKLLANQSLNRTLPCPPSAGKTGNAG